MRRGTRGDQVEKGGQVEIGSQVEKRRPGRKKEARKKNGRKRAEKRRPGRKKEARKKMAEKGPKKFSRFMRHFPTTTIAQQGLQSPIHSFILSSFALLLFFPRRLDG